MSKSMEIAVADMHCASCVISIQEALMRLPGMSEVEVNIASGTVLVSYDEAVLTLPEIKKRINDIGYKVIEHTSEHHEHEHGAAHDMSAIIKLGVSIASTIILVVGSMTGWLPTFAHGWLQLIIATPVQWWAGFEFYRRAWQALKYGRATMDTLIVLGTSMAYGYSAGAVLFREYLSSYAIETHLYFEVSSAIITFVLLGNYLEMLARQRASGAIEQLMNLQPQQAVVWHNNAWKQVSIDQVHVGDRLLVHPGQQIPVDGIIINGAAVIDESMVTGESVPVTKEVGDLVIGATINSVTSFEMEAQKIGSETMLARIIELVKRAQASKPPIQKLVDIISGYFVPAVVILALLSGIIWFFWGPEPAYLHALTIMVAVLIIACPCALGLATPIAVIVGVGRAAAQGILVKDARALELAGKISTVVMDKTGTLTQGKQQVQQVVIIEGIDHVFKKIGIMAADAEASALVRAIIHNASEYSLHPASRALVEYFSSSDIKIELQQAEAIAGMGTKALYQGFTVLIGSQQLMEQESVALAPGVVAEVEDWATQAMTPVFVAVHNTLVAYAGLADKVRDDAHEAVLELDKRRIAVIMLTGDNQTTAKVVADSLGIKHFFARVLPQDKESMVRSIKQKQSGVVAMVGDGINDAPALAAADIGIAIVGGTDIAIEAASIALMRPSLTLIPFLITLSRVTMRVVWQNLGWAFVYNVVLIPVAMGALYPWFGITLNPMLAGAAMAFSSLSVVLNAIRLRSIKIR
ncbi:heavy metal translocating P-type ATPase [Candidatus Dependentiae bacterium]|nr:heavy metal translocating P-type ATPase [Candidatus Dependentiae bacterium]